MRLSEAIRLGATMKPQAFRQTLKDGGTCARGAALDAIGSELDAAAWYRSPWSCWTINTDAVCPECGYAGSLSVVLTICLNDIHRWSRERIADFVELHEPLPAEPAEIECEHTVSSCEQEGTC